MQLIGYATPAFHSITSLLYEFDTDYVNRMRVSRYLSSQLSYSIPLSPSLLFSGMILIGDRLFAGVRARARSHYLQFRDTVFDGAYRVRRFSFPSRQAASPPSTRSFILSSLYYLQL